ncbi:MAG: DUF721 domain-containing protein [Gammaproteobacteria bacterium]|nr:DUF721 domain-containing protein [Gammaproteobacteria bacterium]
MKHIDQQLNHGLVSKARHLEQLTALLDTQLPRETSGHYHVAAIDNSTLTIVTDSPVWTSRLRQLGPDIIKMITEQRGKQIQHVKIVSRHGSIRAPLEPCPTVDRELSEAASQQLVQSAKHIEDEALRQVLLKLSKRGKRGD